MGSNSLSVLERPRRRPDVRFIYFIGAARTKLVKIGVADDPVRRFRELHRSNADPLTLFGVIACAERGRMERSLHRRFCRERMHGEWFYLSGELARFIRDYAVAPERLSVQAAEARLDLAEARANGWPTPAERAGGADLVIPLDGNDLPVAWPRRLDAGQPIHVIFRPQNALPLPSSCGGA